MVRATEPTFDGISEQEFRSLFNRKRILEYNKDDCRALRVLLDAIHGSSPSAIHV